jgi:uncharacterized protein (DUF169 family)
VDKIGGKMNNIHKTFSSRFRSQWIKVKFYDKAPDIKGVRKPKSTRFCEAVREAILHPVILDRKNVNCPGALYAFGWQGEDPLIEHCVEKGELSREMVKSMLPHMPRLDTPFEYIGLNTDGEPDLILSGMKPKEVMDLLNLYHRRTGKHLNVALSSMMSVCGGIAVRTFIEKRISFSFGCMDSRKFAQIGGDRLIAGVPKDFFDLVS